PQAGQDLGVGGQLLQVGAGGVVAAPELLELAEVQAAPEVGGGGGGGRRGGGGPAGGPGCPCAGSRSRRLRWPSPPRRGGGWRWPCRPRASSRGVGWASSRRWRRGWRGGRRR